MGIKLQVLRIVEVFVVFKFFDVKVALEDGLLNFFSENETVMKILVTGFLASFQ